VLRKITKSIILKEALRVDPSASVQALYDIVTSIRTTTQRDSSRVSLAKEHLRSIKSHMRSLNERVNSLEEQLKLLNEEK
jgi:polyhydroxyalkanoate synthesis regulator phasin